MLIDDEIAQNLKEKDEFNLDMTVLAMSISNSSASTNSSMRQ